MITKIFWGYRSIRSNLFIIIIKPFDDTRQLITACCIETWELTHNSGTIAKYYLTQIITKSYLAHATISVNVVHLRQQENNGVPSGVLVNLAHNEFDMVNLAQFIIL